MESAIAHFKRTVKFKGYENQPLTDQQLDLHTVDERNAPPGM